MTFLRVSLPGTELRRLQSKIMNSDYQLHVALPSSYAMNEAREYSVLYFVDGNISFAATTQIYRNLAMAQEAPKLILSNSDSARRSLLN